MPNKQHVIVVQDNFSRFPAAKIAPSTAAPPVISALGDIYNDYGNPEIHRTDTGPPFNSREFSKFSESRRILHKKKYPYHPQGNPVETLMKPLGKSMKTAFFHNQNPETNLNEFEAGYRSTPHIATGVTPGNIVFRNGYRSSFPQKKLNQQEVKERRGKIKQMSQ